MNKIDNIDNINTSIEDSKSNTKNASDAKDKKFNWYLVRVFSGSEEAIINQIKSLAKTRGMDKLFKDFFFPKIKLTTKKRDAKGNENEKTKETFKKLFPGYLAIQMVMNEGTSNLVKDLPKVLDFIGTKKAPKVLSDQDLKNFFESPEKMAKINEHNTIKSGHPVKIKTGSFAGFKATVINITDDKAFAMLSVPVFNTQTEITLPIADIEMIKD